jgi:hypothetical protein
MRANGTFNCVAMGAEAGAAAEVEDAVGTRPLLGNAI